MLKIPFLLIVWVFLLQACHQEREYYTHNLDWLEGEWKGSQGESTFLESWKSIEDSILLGWGVSLDENGDTTFSEKLRIRKIGKKLYYVPEVSHNKGPVFFGIIRLTDEEVVFENKLHDFPKAITYLRRGQDSVHIKLEGATHKGYRSVWFKLGRKRTGG